MVSGVGSAPEPELGGEARLCGLTNLHSDPTKAVLVGTEMRNGRVHFLRDTVYLNGHPVRCTNGQDYVRVLGRHALPHLYHPVDSKRLFSGTMSACRALRAPRLPAHYPLTMFVAKCHGTVNWFTSVRPPSYRAMRVLHAMAASALRATAGWALLASAHFLREIPEGGVGIPQALAVWFANFLSVDIRHLNHPTPLVRRSTRHGPVGRQQSPRPGLTGLGGRGVPPRGWSVCSVGLVGRQQSPGPGHTGLGGRGVLPRGWSECPVGPVGRQQSPRLLTALWRFHTACSLDSAGEGVEVAAVAGEPLGIIHQEHPVQRPPGGIGGRDATIGFVPPDFAIYAVLHA